jgi:hypothetical protein
MSATGRSPLHSALRSPLRSPLASPWEEAAPVVPEATTRQFMDGGLDAVYAQTTGIGEYIHFTSYLNEEA